MNIVTSASQPLTVQPKPRVAAARQVVPVSESPPQQRQVQRSLLNQSSAQPGAHPGVQQYQVNASLDAELGKTIALLGVDTYV